MPTPHGEPNRPTARTTVFQDQALTASRYLEYGFQTANRSRVPVEPELAKVVTLAYHCNLSAFVAKCGDIALKDRLNARSLLQHNQTQYLQYDGVDLVLNG